MKKLPKFDEPIGGLVGAAGAFVPSMWLAIYIGHLCPIEGYYTGTNIAVHGWWGVPWAITCICLFLALLALGAYAGHKYLTE